MQLFSMTGNIQFLRTRKFILGIFLFSFVLCHGQEKLKKIVLNDPKNHLSEMYYVMLPDKIIKQGEYKLTGTNKTVFIEGNYRNNNRTGVWKFYNNSGELIRQFDFDRDSLISYKWNATDSTIMRVKTTDGWKLKEVSSPPFPLYGNLNFIISHNLNYPAEARKNKIEGRVVISMLIDKTGDVHGYRVVTKSTEALNEEALRVVSLIAVWYPAICDGKKTECEYLVPVDFKLK